MCTGLGLGPQASWHWGASQTEPTDSPTAGRTAGPTHQERPASWSLEVRVSLKVMVQMSQSKRKTEGGARAPRLHGPPTPCSACLQEVTAGKTPDLLLGSQGPGETPGPRAKPAAGAQKHGKGPPGLPASRSPQPTIDGGSCEHSTLPPRAQARRDGCAGRSPYHHPVPRDTVHPADLCIYLDAFSRGGSKGPGSQRVHVSRPFLWGSLSRAASDLHRPCWGWGWPWALVSHGHQSQMSSHRLVTTCSPQQPLAPGSPAEETAWGLGPAVEALGQAGHGAWRRATFPARPTAPGKPGVYV